MYSGTPPYDHPVYKTTSLLRPYSFKPNVKTIESFYYFEDPVNATTSLLRPGFYGPTVVALTGFHCTTMLIFIINRILRYVLCKVLRTAMYKCYKNNKLLYYYYWILQLRQGFTPHQLHIQYLPMNILAF